jgi:hypothetical protein
MDEAGRCTMTVLVAYATTGGSTAEIAAVTVAPVSGRADEPHRRADV